jgi:GNAT superfamily N-acetyltransferase
MIYREAVLADIPQIQLVRNAVKENVLSNPALVTDADCAHYITKKGKGWVCESDGQVVAFAIVDVEDRNVWALFVHPDHEAKGIGKQLHDRMIDWYFSQTQESIWLGTAFITRAEKFYRLQGWKENGLHGRNEIKFEMSFDEWNQKQQFEI